MYWFIIPPSTAKIGQSGDILLLGICLMHLSIIYIPQNPLRGTRESEFFLKNEEGGRMNYEL